MAMKWSGSSLREKQVHRNGDVMPTKKQKKELEALAVMPDEKIDFSDIPEVTDKQWAGVRGLFARPETRHISIRLSAVDLVIANKLAAAKGLPYQTYIKSLLHESLVKENSK
jgi:predicted DNA binding CopG/RHH family protein